MKKIHFTPEAQSELNKIESAVFKIQRTIRTSFSSTHYSVCRGMINNFEVMTHNYKLLPAHASFACNLLKKQLELAIKSYATEGMLENSFIN